MACFIYLSRDNSQIFLYIYGLKRVTSITKKRKAKNERNFVSYKTLKVILCQQKKELKNA